MRVSRVQRGFTLIEVLVALALMAMIATILITSLQIGGHTWQRVTRASAQSDQVAQAQAFLRLRLESLYTYEAGAADRHSPPFLASDTSGLEFVSDSPDAAPSGMRRYRLSVDRSSGDLTIQSFSRLDDSPPADQWATEPLLDHVESLSVQFWQPIVGAPGHWVERWEDSTHVPPLIRIEVAFSAKDPRRWPPFYVEPRVTTPVTCQFDVVSRQCRVSS